MSGDLARAPVVLEKRDVDHYLRVLHAQRREVEASTGKTCRVHNRKVGRSERLRLLDGRIRRVLAAVDRAIDHATREEES